MVAPAHFAHRQQAEAEPEEADVERRRERDRADLPEEPEVRADGGEAAEDRRGERAAAEQKQQQERPAGRLQGVGPTLEGHAPELVHRVLSREEDAHPRPERSGEAEPERERTAVQRATAQLRADHRELAKRGADNRPLEVLIALQEKAKHGREHQQQQEDREEPGEADRGRQVAALSSAYFCSTASGKPSQCCRCCRRSKALYLSPSLIQCRTL